MASYGDLVRKITTAEINRVQREGAYTRWAYYVDGHASKVGIIVANDTTFAAYSIDDTPDPKLSLFGQEVITDLILVPDPELLILKTGDNEFRGSVFKDPLVIFDDDFTDAYNETVGQDWQQFLASRNVRVRASPQFRVAKVTMMVIAGLIIFFIVLAFT